MTVDEHRIVVGVDGSTGSSRALQWAMETGARYDAAVAAVLAWEWGLPTIDVLSPSTPVEVAVEAVHAVQAQVAKAVVDRPASVGEVQVTAKAIEGDPPTVLTSAPARLLVLGQHGQSVVRRRLLGPALGSVASHCLSSATVPVVIVPAQAAPGPPRRVVVGVDGSPSSSRALRWAVLHGQAVGAPVTAVYSWQMTFVAAPERASTTTGPPVPPLSTWQDEAQRQLRETVALTLTAAEAADVELLTVHRPSAAGLLESVHEDDLLVLGERGKGGFRRLLLGSVSRHCAEYAPCPVVIVPPADRAAGAGADPTG